MKIKDIEAYENWKAKQTDGYKGIVRYAEGWADLMEEAIKEGKELKDVAEELSHKADTEGITGFMYNCAVSVLCCNWEYGEELQEWHNNKYNYTGNGVVNSAILRVKKD